MPHSEPPSDKVKSHPPNGDCASPSSYLGLNQAISPRSTPKCTFLVRSFFTSALL